MLVSKPRLIFKRRYLQQHLFALLEFAAFEERSGEVQQHFCVLVFVKFLQAVFIL